MARRERSCCRRAPQHFVRLRRQDAPCATQRARRRRRRRRLVRGGRGLRVVRDSASGQSTRFRRFRRLCPRLVCWATGKGSNRSLHERVGRPRRHRNDWHSNRFCSDCCVTRGACAGLTRRRRRSLRRRRREWRDARELRRVGAMHPKRATNVRGTLLNDSSCSPRCPRRSCGCFARSSSP